MRDRPDGVALLREARAVLLDELLERLPEDRRYQARLVANAMAIAARELEAGDRPAAAERAALSRLYSEPRRTGPDGTAPEAPEETRQRLTWRLAAEVRAGYRDGDAEVYAFLRERAVQRLRVTNPKVLEGREGS